MVIRFRRIIFYSALLLFCMFCAAPAFGSETAGSNANQAGTLILDAQELWKLQNSGSQTIRLAGQQICADSPDAVCIVPVTAPYFDSAVLCWTGSGSPVVSLRVYDAETGLWGDWQPIPESGQRYPCRKCHVPAPQTYGSIKTAAKLQKGRRCHHFRHLRSFFTALSFTAPSDIPSPTASAAHPSTSSSEASPHEASPGIPDPHSRSRGHRLLLHTHNR